MLPTLLATIITVILLSLYYMPYISWVKLRLAGIKISAKDLFFMRIRKSPMKMICNTTINIHKAGIKNIGIEELEAHYHSGGNVNKVAEALITAHQNNIALTFQMATAIDLTGHDILKTIENKTSIN